MNVMALVDAWIVQNGRYGYGDDEAAERVAQDHGVPVEYVKAAVEGRWLGREFASRERRSTPTKPGAPSWEYENGVFPFVEVHGWVILLQGGAVAEDKQTMKPGFWLKRARAQRVRTKLPGYMQPATLAPCVRVGSTYRVAS